MGPAERADIIIDFSQCPVNSTLIMYNDAAAPVPARDHRYDLQTAGFDFTTTAGNPFGASGGAAPTQPGFGPNTRTIMQFRVVKSTGTPDPYNAATTLTGFEHGAAYPLRQVQPGLPVPPNDPTFYGSLTNPTSTGLFSEPGHVPVEDEEKDINEQFDIYGRMNATLAAFNVNAGAIVHGIPILGTVGAYVDPPTEIMKGDGLSPRCGSSSTTGWMSTPSTFTCSMCKS